MKFLSLGHLKTPIGGFCLGLAELVGSRLGGFAWHPLTKTMGSNVPWQRSQGAALWDKLCDKEDIHQCDGRSFERDVSWYDGAIDVDITLQISQISLMEPSPACRYWCTVWLLMWAPLLGHQDEWQLRLSYLLMANDSPKSICVYTSLACHWHTQEEFILPRMSCWPPSSLCVASIVWANTSFLERFSLTQSLICLKTQRLHCTGCGPREQGQTVGDEPHSTGHFVEERLLMSTLGLGEYHPAETYFWQEMPVGAEVGVGWRTLELHVSLVNYF